MTRREFFCADCGQSWFDKYSFWLNYFSRCPSCGRLCKSLVDIEAREKNRDRGLLLGLPNHEEIDFDQAELDLEAERAEIRDEIVEALAGVSEDDTGEEADADADAGEGESF